MQRFLSTAVCLLLITPGLALARHPGKNGKDGKPVPAPQHVAVARDRGPTTSIHFSVENVRVIRTHYAPRYRNLPPGLQKKYARSGHLPPGWEKKMEPLPVAIERSLPPLPVGYRRGVIDGHAVIYRASSGMIIDVAVLF
jgi:hypothetical protein